MADNLSFVDGAANYRFPPTLSNSSAQSVHVLSIFRILDTDITRTQHCNKKGRPGEAALIVLILRDNIGCGSRI